MAPDLRIIRSDDPECADLEARGYAVVARSWGATLDLDDPQTVPRIRAAVEAGQALGLVMGELSITDAAAFVAVEAANHADYPQDPATRHDAVTRETYAAMLASGSRAWGGSRNGNLIGVALASPKATGWWDITFASVLAGHRGTGKGQAIVGAMILALRADGVARISTGGAASNSASRGAALALGAVLEPEWRTYSPPAGSRQVTGLAPGSERC